MRVAVLMDLDLEDHETNRSVDELTKIVGLHTAGWTQADIAQYIGYSQKTVSDALELLDEATRVRAWWFPDGTDVFHAGALDDVLNGYTDPTPEETPR